jgi:hypothetical protein
MMRMFGIGTRRAMLPAQPFTAEQEARIIRMIAVALNAHDAQAAASAARWRNLEATVGTRADA